MILIIDNYDSFTYNVYQYVASLGHTVKVIRNDAIVVREIELKAYSAIIISPGPGTPDDAGISKVVIRAFAGRIPILGVCLGHQAIGEVFGGKVIRAPQPVHGKVSLIQHTGSGIYEGLPQPFPAGRYHSLVVERDSLPDCLEVTATSSDGLIMGLRHRKHNVEGVQFHPESILTPCGMQLLKNFLAKT
jgi:anthranilate synthase component II